MRLHTKDWVATALVALAVLYYIGFLVRGAMPLVQDPRGMSAIALVLGVVAFVLLGSATTAPEHRAPAAAAALSVAIGVVTFILGHTAAAPPLLAVFIVSIVVAWALPVLERAGYVAGGHGRPAVHR